MPSELQQIPASQILPTAFNSQTPEWLWRPKDIPKGGSNSMYLLSTGFAGWRYYSLKKEVKLSVDFPENYEDDIGYKYKHGPNVVNPKGEPMEEKDRPVKLLLFRVWIKECNAMRCAVIDSWPLQQSIAQIFSNPELMLFGSESDGFCSNFFLQIHHNNQPASASLTYTAHGFVRPPQNEQMLMAAADPWCPENYFQGLNPFEPPAQPPVITPPPGTDTVRTREGADLRAQPAQRDERW